MSDATLQIVPVDAQLVALAGKSGLEPQATDPLVSSFRPHFAAARVALADAAGVAESVKDATCVTEIKKSRACRLQIRAIRIASEKTRKEQKEKALAYGRAVDGFHNILLADIGPVETALLNAEETAERAETARKDALESGRKTALALYVSDASLYAVREMSEQAFAALLTGVRVAKEQADAAAAKAEADRMEAEKARITEEARIRDENVRLQCEAQEREAAAKKEREEAAAKLAAEQAAAAKAKADADARAKAAQMAAEAALQAERKRLEAIAAAERAKAAKAAEEAAAKAKAERDAIQAQADAARKASEEAQARARAETVKLKAEADAREKAEVARKAAELVAARKAAAAPDREKLAAFARSVRSLEVPALSTAPGIAELIAAQRDKFASWVDEKGGAL
jgi:hypothetical protein